MEKSVKTLKWSDPKCRAILKAAGMTDSHLWELYLKQESVAFLNDAFGRAYGDGYPFGSAVGCEFKVYLDESKHRPGEYFLEEYLIVRYSGGAWAARRANINSNSVNFQEIGKMLNGGCYDEVKEVERLEKEAYRLILGHNGRVEIALPTNHDDHE